MQRRPLLILAIGALLISGASLVSGQPPKPSSASKDWIPIKDPNELRALFSNKTFKGVGWTAYYRSDGTGILVVDGGKPVARRWEVKGDQVCITGDATGVTGCRSLDRHRKNANEITMTNPLTKDIYTVKVEDGIPNF